MEPSAGAGRARRAQAARGAAAALPGPRRARRRGGGSEGDPDGRDRPRGRRSPDALHPRARGPGAASGEEPLTMAKDKEPKKEKKAKKGNGDEKAVLVSIAQPPRAKAGIRRARTRAAFIAFVLVFALNWLG